MHNPPHPGEILQGLYLEPLELSITDTAKGLGISRSALSEYVNGHTSTTKEIAMRLAKAFGTTPGVWLRHQAAYDEWQSTRENTAYLENVTVFHVNHNEGSKPANH